MSSLSVSVIIPAYNAALYLEPAIDSVLAQTFRNFDVIVVDDGSTDETPQIAAKFGDSVYCIHQSNQGLSGARNTGIRNSQGEVIALLDADDLWEPHYLETMINMLEGNPQAVGVYCGFHYIDAQGRFVGKPSLKVIDPREFHHALVYNGNWLVPSAVMFRRIYAEKAGLFDIEIGPVADADLWIKLSRQGPMVGIPEALIRYRRHDNNMSKDPGQMVAANYRRIQKVHGPETGDIAFWPPEKVVSYRNFYRSSASRYLASGNAQKSAYYLQKLSSMSPEYFFSLEMWRRLIRAHIPDEFQFDPSFQIDWGRASSDIEALITELGRMASMADKALFWRSRAKSSAYLALADEAGRSGKLLKTLGWLLKAVFISPQIMFSRSYWGTAWRSVDGKVSR
jgi:glycosyltransferase involved in cell wall biosynthesis